MKHFRLLGTVLVLVMGFWALTAVSAKAAEEKQKKEARKVERVRGRLVNIQPEAKQFSVLTRDDQVLQLQVDERSLLWLEREKANLSDFEEGTRVRVAYESVNGKNRVVTLRTPLVGPILLRVVKETLEAAQETSFEEKGEYEQKFEQTLEDLDEEIQTLKDRAGKVKAEAREEYAREMEELRKKREAVQKKLNQVKTADREGWEEVKAGVAAALEDLQQAVEQARSRYQQ